jgi:hypothetical protein
MKTAVYLPDAIFHAAERLCERHRIPRSRFYAMAIKRMIDELERQDVTAKLNEVYQNEASSLDAGLQRAQSAILDDEKW